LRSKGFWETAAFAELLALLEVGTAAFAEGDFGAAEVAGTVEVAGAGAEAAGTGAAAGAGAGAPWLSSRERIRIPAMGIPVFPTKRVKQARYGYSLFTLSPWSSPALKFHRLRGKI